ncbi:MAG: hypothetical protein H0T47_03220 [Planctomycetaceae bacterium]|nr:hypothetical protein [Planctomycetaceae bacterium]
MPIVKKDDGVIAVALDLEENKLWTTAETTRTVFKSLSTEDEVSKEFFENIANGNTGKHDSKYSMETAAKLNSILTSEEYLSLSPKEKYGQFKNVPDLAAC